MASSVPKTLGLNLVELLRKETNVGYSKCQHTISILLTEIRNEIPTIGPVIDEILESAQSKMDDTSVENSHDAKRLSVIFSEMAACKDDSQQRSWALYEDEEIILEYLEELFSILSKANASVSRHLIRRENYECVDTLVLYYQMETRSTIRNVLLNVFAALCGLDVLVIDILLNSILPLELARDIQTDTSDLQKFCYSCVVLTVIFSTGQELPIQHYDFLNSAFIVFLLSYMENPPWSGVDEDIVDAVLPMILSYNLHFYQPSDNIVMQVLAEHGAPNELTGKVISLANRGDDPVKMYPHQENNPNSVLKFLSDIFSGQATSELIYTNDAKVLIDIIAREISNQSPGKLIRTEFLSLMHLIMKTPSYAEHQHQITELRKGFLQVFNEDIIEISMDKDIVKQIWKDVPQFF
ncbi:NCK-interacting protein with SH3 domain-like isoform X2 [Tubulanus polymorphus]